MTPREIADLFAQMELRLIKSLKRNLSAHKAEERRQGIQWPAWQAEKLRSIRRYREDNRSIVSGYTDVIDREVEQLLQEEYAAGSAQVDREAAAAGVDAPADTPRFFGVNRQKLDSLIEEINGGLHDAESASLRTMDDVYRRTLYRAELELASGSVTVPQAVDMAVRDFLSAGINCVEYSDGRRVNIASYAEMALRTASTRATLRGEAERRKAYNIDTVLVSQYGACSETCLPWQGRVYIDDVWGEFDGDTSGDMGRSVNGKWYPLLSMAVAAGLFHPNCRHTVSTWFEGDSRMPPPMDADRVREISKLEQEQRRMERKVRRYKRLAEGTQDPKQAKEYRRKVRGAQAELRGFIADHDDVLRRDYWREKDYGLSRKISSLASAGDHDILEKYKDVTFPPGSHLEGLSREAVTKTVNEMGKALESLPELRGMIQDIGVNDGPGIMAVRPKDDFSGVTLNFNRRYYSGIDVIKNAFEADQKRGSSPAGTSWEQIGIHELGHVAVAKAIQKSGKPLAEIETDWNDDITAEKIVKAAYESGDLDVDMDAAVRTISGYAAVSPSEAIGEALMDVYANGGKSQRMSRLILKELVKWL